VGVSVGFGAGGVADGVQVALGDGVPEGVGLRGVRVGVGVGTGVRGRQAASSASRLALLSPARTWRRLRRGTRLWSVGSSLKMYSYLHIPNYIPNMFGI
jgi:hypothetical protein